MADILPNDIEIEKYIERHPERIARIIKPHLQTQAVLDADSGNKRDQKRIFKNVVLDGLSQTYSIPEKSKFSNPDSVMINTQAPTPVVIYAEMINGYRFKLSAASEVTNLKVKVLMRGY